MNRISRRSAAESAEALLEVGRTEPVLHYDVELGLARHHHWLRSDAPLPEWASASVGGAAKSLVPVVVKTFVSVVLIGTFAVAAWQARSSLQPSAAEVHHPSPGAESAAVATPTASEESTTPIPMPVAAPSLPTDAPTRRAVRAEVPDKRVTRFQRAHKEVPSARAASPAAAPHADPEPARSAGDVARTSVTTEASADRTPATDFVAPEPKPSSAAQAARPEPAPQAQRPDDMLEMQQVATAEQLLARSPGRALTLVRQGDQRFARGYFQQERAYIAIMALIRLGRIDEARARAASFAQRFPALPYGARIRSALDTVR